FFKINSYLAPMISRVINNMEQYFAYRILESFSCTVLIGNNGIDIQMIENINGINIILGRDRMKLFYRLYFPNRVHLRLCHNSTIPNVVCIKNMAKQLMRSSRN